MDLFSSGTRLHRALTIAGSDSGGGAGIQADLKAFQARGVYGASVISLVTSQNTAGVQSVYNLPMDVVGSQLDSVLSDIRFDAIKTGALGSKEIIHTVSDKLKNYMASRAKRSSPLIIDPVIVSTSGNSLLSEDALETLKTELMPLATLVTPNIPEASKLVGWHIDSESESDIRKAATEITTLGCGAVLIKGGHGVGETSVDILHYDGSKVEAFVAPRIITRSSHGTGCTLSAVITAEMAKDPLQLLSAAVWTAKKYTFAAMKYGVDNLGLSGNGALHHGVGLFPVDFGKYEMKSI